MKPNKKLLPCIRDRYSPRKFKEKEVEKEKIDLILEAARWAPSGFNNQPWRYIVVNKNSKNREKLEDSLMPGNGWAKTASSLIVCFTNKKFQKSESQIPYYVYDVGLSVMNLTIEAEHQGLKTHQMGGFFAKKVKDALSIPDDFDVLVVIALGYEEKKLGLQQKSSEGVRNSLFRPRKRKDIDEIVFYDEFKKD